MITRYFLIFILGVFIDGFQAGLSSSMEGAGAGVVAALGWIPIIGEVTAGAAVSAGVIAGIIFNFCLSTTFGAFQLTILGINRMFHPSLLIFGAIELIPVINNLPGWSGMVLAAIWMMYKKEQAEKMPQANPINTSQPSEYNTEPAAASRPRMEDIRTSSRGVQESAA